MARDGYSDKYAISQADTLEMSIRQYQKNPVQILYFANGKKEPLSRKILGKAAPNALGKGAGLLILRKTALASFCHASQNGRNKPGSR